MLLFCAILGEWLNEIEPIKILKHGRKAKSFFLYGFEYLDEIFSNYEFRTKELTITEELFKIEYIVQSEYNFLKRLHKLTIY